MDPAGEGLFNPCGLLPVEGPFVEHHRDGESVGVAVRNSPDYLRRCCISNRWLYDAGRFRDLMETGMSSVLASARLPATMTFDLPGPCCVNEYEYFQRLAGLGQLSAEEGPQDVSLALMFLTKPVLRVDANGLAREGLGRVTRILRFPWTGIRRRGRLVIWPRSWWDETTRRHTLM